MQVRLREILEIVEQIAPTRYAASWDNTGLQIGAPDDPIRSILVALDMTPGVVKEALQKKSNLIIAHHPLFFHPLKRIRTDTGTGRMVEKVLQAGIAVVAAHTNLDVVQDGVNDVLGKALGLQGWSSIQEISIQDGIGWGRIGDLKKEKSLDLFIAELKETLRLRWARLIGRPPAKVKRLAWCSGSGAGLFPDVLSHAPDLFITGDIKYHEAIGFQMEGVPVLDIGHFASEQGIRKALAQRLRRSLKDLNKPIPIYTSRSERDPFRIV